MASGDPGEVIEQVRHLNRSEHVLLGEIPSYSASDPSGEISVACQWTAGMTDKIHSFVNGIATTRQQPVMTEGVTYRRLGDGLVTMANRPVRVCG